MGKQLKMLLTILIPTYNRSKQLMKNLSMLSAFIRKNNLNDSVTILVSDNHSSDGTYSMVKNFIKENNDIKIVLFRQEENTGLEKNALFVLREAITDYVMYIGDDDYIKEEYLVKVIETLRNKMRVTCILPGIHGTDPITGKIVSTRDEGEKTNIYEPSFKSCYENSYRGNQLSGIVLYRNNLYEEYIKRNVCNIYPFIFFVAYSSLRGRLLHLTDYPVEVSVVPQGDKDWDYKDDGLISEIFDNYRCLYNRRKDFLKRSLLELKLLNVQSWRYLAYLKLGNTAFIYTIINIITSKNTSVLTKVFFPFLVLLKFFRKILRFIF